MAEIRPFRGVRYVGSPPTDLSRLVTAPYDVISQQAQTEYYARDQFNAIRLELGRQSTSDGDEDSRYTRAAATYRQWRTLGTLQADAEPAFYVARESFQMNGQEKSRTTLFTLVRLYDWDERQVLPHERTMPKPKADRLSLLRSTQVQFSPIFSLYDDLDHSVAKLLAGVAEQHPIAVVDLDPPAVAAASTHTRVWRIVDPATIHAITSAFSHRVIYIADGHHRYETALAYRDETRSVASGQGQPQASDYLMMSLSASNDPGVDVMATHRLLRSSGPSGYSVLARLLEPTFDALRLGEADVDAFLQEPDETGLRVVVVSANETELLGLRLNADPTRMSGMPAGRHPSWKMLDVACLHELILNPHFGLDDADLAGGAGVEYTRDPKDVILQVRSGEFDWGFIMRPTRLSQVLDVARANETMPPKSTYFYPKSVTGLAFFDHREAL